MTFEEYLISKKIDGKAFLASEPAVYQTWKIDFEQMHPNSFTVQRLNLINPIRRKYLLAEPTVPATLTSETTSDLPPSTTPKSVSKPMIRPKPKIN